MSRKKENVAPPEVFVLWGTEVWLAPDMKGKNRAFRGYCYSRDTPGAEWREAVDALLTETSSPIERVEVHQAIVIVIYKSSERRECDVAMVLGHADQD